MRRPFVPRGKKDHAPVVVSFGMGEPQGEHEYGLAREARPGGLTWLAVGADATAEAGGEAGARRLVPVDVLRIKGAHNATTARPLALNGMTKLPLAPGVSASRTTSMKPTACSRWPM